MAVIALTSASGSPGVTTTAVGWALTRQRRTILLDADPTGGSPILAGYLRGQLAPPDALVELVVAQQQGNLRATLPAVTMPLPDSQVAFIPGPRSHTQARALSGLWEPLLAALKGLAGTGQDAIVDLGRLGLAGAATPFLMGADLTLVACRSDLVSLAGARSWVGALRTEFAHIGAESSLGIVLVGPGNPYSAAEVSKVLGVPVVASLDWDPKAAAAFSTGTRPRRLERSKLVTSLRRLDSHVTAALSKTQPALDEQAQEAAS